MQKKVFKKTVSRSATETEYGTEKSRGEIG
jgi:hypothetical protein